jgi:RNA polymerase sigma factor (sigma-70 family)
MNFGGPFVAEQLGHEAMAELPLATLLSALGASDRVQASAAAAEIIRRFEPLMRRTWYRLAGPAADYEDYRQEAVLKLFRALPQLREADAFPGFFRSVIVSVAYDQLKRLRPEGVTTLSLDEIDLPSQGDTPFADIDTGIIVNSLLQELHGREREVLYLDAVLGMTPNEIARRLGLSAGAVRMTKSRAIKRLTELLRQKHDALSEKKAGLP